MREIDVSVITDNVAEMCISVNHFLSDDMKCAIEKSYDNEKNELGKVILEKLKDNLQIAGEEMIPICQDTGMAVIIMKLARTCILQAEI